MAVIAFALFLHLLFVPEIIFTLFQVEANESAFFISRRAAMLFLGIALFSWFGRNAPHSELRQAICIGMSISMLAMAISGVIEFARNYAGIGIFLAVVTEIVLSVAYFNVWRTHKSS